MALVSETRAELPSEAEGRRKVLIAVDGSDKSDAALNWALQNVIVPQDDFVVLVTVEPAVALYAGGAGGAYAVPEDAILKLEEDTASEADSIFKKAEEICKANEVPYASRMVRGDAREALCLISEDLKVDLLVLGSRGLGPLKRAFLGSVSDYCVKHAPCPVLVVKTE